MLFHVANGSFDIGQEPEGLMGHGHWALDMSMARAQAREEKSPVFCQEVSSCCTAQLILSNPLSFLTSKGVRAEILTKDKTVEKRLTLQKWSCTIDMGKNLRSKGAIKMRLVSQGQVLSQTSSGMKEAPSYSKLSLNFVHGFCDF